LATEARCCSPNFSFEGAIIANNLVDKAATGVSVTNFNEGGRLAVVQGNLIHNLFLRKYGESYGVGIAVEADSVVTGNVIEGSAAAYGILIGWGRYLRDVSVTDNLIRNAMIGIGVSIDPAAGTALITNNLITGAKDGAIRHERPDADRPGPCPGKRRGLPQPRGLRQRCALGSSHIIEIGANHRALASRRGVAARASRARLSASLSTTRPTLLPRQLISSPSS
jgi:putative cofactor-binding repeat protein